MARGQQDELAHARAELLLMSDACLSACRATTLACTCSTHRWAGCSTAPRCCICSTVGYEHPVGTNLTETAYGTQTLMLHLGL